MGCGPGHRVVPAVDLRATCDAASTVGFVETTPGPHLGDSESGVEGDTEPADSEAVLESGSVEDAVEPEGDPLRFSNWMHRSATGAVLSGIALGLHHALEPKRQQPAFVMEAPGEPEDPDAPIMLHFDPDDPTKTVAVIRAPHDQATDTAADQSTDQSTDDHPHAD